VFDGSRGVKMRPRGHFKMSCLASYRKRLSGTRLLIGSALAGISASIPRRSSAVDFGVGIAGIGGDRFYVDPHGRSNFVHLGLDHLAFIRLSSASTSRMTPTLSSTAVCCL
jgi:hypothetical protein